MTENPVYAKLQHKMVHDGICEKCGVWYLIIFIHEMIFSKTACMKAVWTCFLKYVLLDKIKRDTVVSFLYLTSKPFTKHVQNAFVFMGL
jgi:hypothetical protein